MIYTPDNFEFHADLVGCLVNNDVVDNVINCLPPACMRSTCTQLGSPYSHREDPDTGKFRPTFATFCRVSEDAWRFCGFCFRGENVPRGEDPVYCRL